MTPAKQRLLIIGLILLGTVVVGFFGMRALHAFRKFNGQRPPPFPENTAIETDVELIREWMTLGYISHTYHLHPMELYKALGIPPKGNEKKSLEELNDEYFPDQPGYVLELVKATVKAALPETESPPTAVP